MAKRRISGEEAERLVGLSARIQDAGTRLRDASIKAADDTPSAFDPRELRIALDGVAIGHAALVALLIEQGTLSGERYLESLAECMEDEADDLDGELPSNT